MSRKGRSDAAAAEYGFRWGPLDVTRLSVIGGFHCVEVASDFGRVEVYVSKAGRSIRVFKGSQEMKVAAPTTETEEER